MTVKEKLKSKIIKGIIKEDILKGFGPVKRPVEENVVRNVIKADDVFAILKEYGIESTPEPGQESK